MDEDHRRHWIQPPYRPQVCTFSLPRGMFKIEWPCRITQQEYDLFMNVFDLLRDTMREHIQEPVEPPPLVMLSPQPDVATEEFKRAKEVRDG